MFKLETKQEHEQEQEQLLEVDPYPKEEVVVVMMSDDQIIGLEQEQQQQQDDEAYDRFTELCADLNLDTVTKEKTWETFTSVRNKYTLEGDVAHWLCCAVYVACRQANIPSVNHLPTHGNYVNLTRLLRTSKLSLVEFFDKSRKWGDMTNLNQEFRSKIERLERNFAVTTVIFKKFDPIFAGLFKDFSGRELDEYRANRKKLSPKSAADLFEFCWTLFLCVKSSLRISDDLVNSYHLLLACTDLIFYNVASAQRKNLLTTQFAELADNLTDPTGEPICIIHKLCDLYDGISVEAKTIKEFWLKPKIRNMIDQGTLKGETESLAGLIDEAFFEHNFRRLEKEYEEYVLTEGDFDERMYLSVLRQADFGVDPQHDYFKTLDRQSLDTKTYPPLQELRHLMPQTPLSGKKYLSEKEDHLNSPITTATQMVSRLQAMLSNRKPEVTPTLQEIFNNCVRNPTQSIQERLAKYSELFCQGCSLKYYNQPGMHAEFAHFRCQIGQTLYYRLLESILTAESKLRNDNSELTDLLEEDNFHTSLFACSLEIVLFSYNSYRRFPWIIEVFQLPAYHLYKVVEIIIRAEDSLSRDVVKHLSQVEERVLEELAWKNQSPLWDALAQRNEPIPPCEEVLLPSQIEKMGGDATLNGEGAPKRYAVIKTPQGEKCVPVAVGGNNQSTLIIQDKNSSQILGVVLPSKHGDKPKKGNSTALFLRKFYHLSYVRLQDLCKNMSVDDELLRKIWTCFQNAITNHMEELMRGRHVDQILMCCVYVVAKVVGNEKTFTEIMRCYRLQPQSQSYVYRSVPLNSEDERGDLIKFYNTIFIGKMQKYALKFSNRTEDVNVPLSPVPHLKATPLSPYRKVSDRHAVFLRPLRTAKTPSPAKPLRYNFSRSPNTNLRAINAMVQIAGDNKPKVVKRILGDDLSADPIPSKVFARRLQDFIDDRQNLE